jgi:hypothetical protein
VEKKKKSELVAATAKATDQSLLALPIGASAVAKLPGSGGGIRRDGAVTLVEGRGYAAGGAVIPDATVYFDADKRPKCEGGWRGEADKVSWRDEETGLECIIMRDGVGGHLGGYVGVGRNHPLFGFEAGALPNDIGIDVHGGITYARICDEGPSPRRRVLQEGRRICHVVIEHVEAEVSHATYHQVEQHQWWFGFTCNHVYDLKPSDVKSRPSRTDGEIGSTYRDDGYVLNEVRNLARQLKAIESGDPMPVPVGSRPPIGLDPGRRS